MIKEELEKDLMKKFKELNVAEYTTKYGDYYGLMFAGAEIATKELEAQIEKMKSALITIKSNTDDVNIEWQIKYLFDELEIEEK